MPVRVPSDSPPSSPLAFPAGHQPANPPPTTASQTIAITNSTPTSDITNTSNTAAACQPHQPHLHLSSSSSLAGSPAAPASAATYTHIHNSTANAHLPPGSTLHSRRASCDAVPPVEGGASPLANQGTPGSHGGGGGGGGHNANGSGSETLTGATGTTATVSNASASRPQSLPQRQLLVQATAALAAGSGSGGGGSVTRPSSGALDRPPPPLQPPAVERTSSTKSIGSSRSLTGPPGAAAAAAGAMAGGGASLAKPSISTVLQVGSSWLYAPSAWPPWQAWVLVFGRIASCPFPYSCPSPVADWGHACSHFARPQLDIASCSPTLATLQNYPRPGNRKATTAYPYLYL